MLVPSQESSNIFAKVLPLLEEHISRDITNILTGFSYRTHYDPEEKIWWILITSTTETVEKNNWQHDYDLIVTGDLELYGISENQRKIPKPLLMLKVSEINDEIAFLEGIEVVKSLQQNGLGKSVLTILESTLKQQGVTYLASIHYNRKTIDFFRKRWYSNADTSEISTQEKIDWHLKTWTPDNEDYDTLVKKL